MTLRHVLTRPLLRAILYLNSNLTLEGIAMFTAFARIAAVENLVAAQGKTIASQATTIAALQDQLASHGDTMTGMATQESVDALGSKVDGIRSDLGEPGDGADDAAPAASTTSDAAPAATDNGNGAAPLDPAPFGAQPAPGTLSA